MAASDPIPELDAKGLREFALTTGALVAGLFGLLFPWVTGRHFPVWPWAILAVLATWGLLIPRTLRPVYRGWMRFGLAMSRVTTPLIMGLVFFVVVTPMGLVLRLLGRDYLGRRFDPGATTYRLPGSKAPRENLERPF